MSILFNILNLTLKNEKNENLALYKLRYISPLKENRPWSPSSLYYGVSAILQCGILGTASKCL